MNFLTYICVATGGAMGALLRFIINRWFIGAKLTHFPWATLSVNVLGCFLMGIALGVMDKYLQNSAIRGFILAGFLGSLTTFSTFSLEVFIMLQNGRIVMGISYMFLSLFLGLGLLALAFYGTKLWI